MANDEVALADRLNLVWDRRIGWPVHPGGPLGEVRDDTSNDHTAAFAAALERLHAIDDAPPPDGIFAARLRGQLGLTQPAALPKPAPLVLPAGSGRNRFLAGHAWPPAQVAVAAAVVLLLVGGRLLGFDGGDAPPMTAAPTSSSPLTTVTQESVTRGSTTCGRSGGMPPTLVEMTGTPSSATRQTGPGFHLATACATGP